MTSRRDQRPARRRRRGAAEARGGPGASSGAGRGGRAPGGNLTSSKALRPTPRSQLTAGTVAYARVPYASGSDYKIRPVVVVVAGAHDVTVVPCTSKDKSRWNVAVRDWDAAGFELPSWAVIGRPLVLERAGDIKQVVGVLSDADRHRVLRAVGRDEALAPGQVALVSPRGGGDETRPRLVLVVEVSGDAAEVVALAESSGPGTVALTEWESAGLDGPAVALGWARAQVSPATHTVRVRGTVGDETLAAVRAGRSVLEPGDVLIAVLGDNRRRVPVVVTSVGADEARVVRLVTWERPAPVAADRSRVPVVDWEGAGLRSPSAAAVGEDAAVPVFDDVVRLLGSLSARDRAALGVPPPAARAG